MKASLIISMILSLFLVAQVNAEEAAKSEESAAPQKVDMKNIEKKYWQPSDQSYTVVQSRTYSKEKKFGVSLLTGPLLMDSWSEGLNYELDLSYYFTERWGVELQGSFYSTSDNKTVDKIFDLSGSPDYGRVTSFIGAVARWVPFYSKMSFMGTKVVYFDMSFGVGAGMVGYDQQLGPAPGVRATQSATAPAVAFDISQTYFINPKLAFRADYKMRFFNEEIVPFNGLGEAKNELSSIANLDLGLTYFF